MTSKSGNQQTISIEFSDRIYVSLMLAQQLDYIVVTLIAGIVKRGPVIESSVIDKRRIVIFSMSEQLLGLVILSVFAILP